MILLEDLVDPRAGAGEIPDELEHLRVSKVKKKKGRSIFKGQGRNLERAHNGQSWNNLNKKTIALG